MIADRCRLAAFATAPARSVHPATADGDLTNANGSYSEADYNEILAAAAPRHIRIIPSIDLPGHAGAAVKSMEARYHRLLSEGRPDAADTYRARWVMVN